MPTASSLLLFVAALVLLEITPGPDMMLVLARGVSQGRRTALMTVVGMVFVAGIVQVGLLVLGIASLLQAYPVGLAVLRWVGATYLVYLGGRMLLHSFGHRRTTGASARPIPARAAVREGTINSLTNPKSLLFMFAFLPQFVDATAGPVWTQLVVLGTVQKLAGLLSLGSVALASGTVGEWLRRWPRARAWQERFTGLVMVGLGLRLFVTGDPAPRAASGG